MRAHRPAILALAIAAILLTTTASAQQAAASAQQSSLEDRYGAGAQALQQGKALEALQILGAVAEENAAYRDVQMLLGQSCLMAGLPRPAKQHFEQAFQQQPSNAQAAFFLGYSLYEEARYFEAVEVLAKAKSLAPQNPLPRIYRGLALLRQGQAKEAEKEIEAGLAAAPGDLIGERALAELDLAQGRFTQAEARVRSVLRRSPGDTEGRILLGRSLLEGGKATDAVEVFAGLAADEPSRSDLLYLLAQARLRGGDREAGRAAMSRFRELKSVESEVRLLEVKVNQAPDDFASRLELVELMLDNGMARSAVLHLATLQRQRPDDRRVRQLAERLPLRP